ncbi:MAG: DUF2240 family protein [Halobacteriaceae archaeon]
MSLRVAVATPFRQHGTDSLDEHEFVVALSLDRGWFSPDQAKRLADVAVGEGLVDRAGDDLVAAFDPGAVEVPEDFEPDESLLQERSPFERAVAAVVETGVAKQEAVAAVNDLQHRLGVTADVAAVLYARDHGADVEDVATSVRSSLLDDA